MGIKSLIPWVGKPAKTTGTELVKAVAGEGQSEALVKVLNHIQKLEKENASLNDVVQASADLVINYTRPGKSRFKRVVKLRKALENYAKSKGE